jgi:hypothetical protein
VKPPGSGFSFSLVQFTHVGTSGIYAIQHHTIFPSVRK